MTVWSINEESPGSSYGIKIKCTLQSESEQNRISVMETADFGRILTFGDTILLSDCGEDPYHEMLALLPASCSPSVKSVLLIGGSDGGTLGMLIKIPRIEKIMIVGADSDVVESVKSWYPGYATAFTDQRVKIEERDGTEYVRESRERFDLIIVDIPGASTSQHFPQSFFCDCFRLLTSDGAIVTDCGGHSYLQGRRELASAISKLKRLFPVFRLYNTPGILPGLSHRLIAFATKTFDPTAISAGQGFTSSIKTNYINSEIVKAAFSLPEYIHKMTDWS